MKEGQSIENAPFTSLIGVPETCEISPLSLINAACEENHDDTQLPISLMEKETNTNATNNKENDWVDLMKKVGK